MYYHPRGNPNPYGLAGPYRRPSLAARIRRAIRRIFLGIS